MYDEDQKVFTSAEKQIATVKSISNDARWKSAQQLSWKPLGEDFPLSAGDSIFSGENSKIEILFKNQNVMAIDSNTLVVIEQSKTPNLLGLQTLNLNMSYGQLELKSNKITDWKIKNHEEQIALKSGPMSQAQIKVENNNSFQVSLKKGNVEVKHNGTNKKLIPSAPQEIFISASALLEIKNFAKENGIHSSMNDDKNNSETILHIIDDSNLKNKNYDKKLFSKLNAENAEKLKLPQTTNSFAKINMNKKNESKNNSNLNSTGNLKTDSSSELEQIESRINKLTTNSQYKPPIAKVPFHESIVYLYKGNKLNIHFIWTETQKNANSFVIQISTNDLFKPSLITKVTNSNKIDINLPTAGKYFWKVKSLYADDSSPWSDVKFFFVELSN